MGKSIITGPSAGLLLQPTTSAAATYGHSPWSLEQEEPFRFSSTGNRHGWLVRRRRDVSQLPPALASISLTSTVAVSPSKSGPHNSSVTSYDAAASTTALEFLPVGTHRAGPGKKVLRYMWDGTRLAAVDEDLATTAATPHGRFSAWVTAKVDAVYRAFFPDAKDVTPDYWEWLRWRLTQRFFSSTMQNLSTQSLLLALGMGAKKTIAASAAINWLLKDGVGRIARMTVATNFGQSFDSDLKRIRFVTSIVFEATIGCEFITPFFPHHFLPLASIANLGKAIALAAFVATAPAFQQALCVGGNLADITAKNQAQHMVIDMLALGVSAGAMYCAKNMKVPALLPLCAFPLLSVCDLYSIYRELKAVQLKSLNRERAEVVTEAWLATGRVPNAAEVSASERLLLPPNVGGGRLRAEIVPLENLICHPSQLPPLLKQYKDAKYMLRVQQEGTHDTVSAASSSSLSSSSSSSSSSTTSHSQHSTHSSVSTSQRPSFGPLHRWLAPKPTINISLSEDANGADIMRALLEAAYLRQAVQQRCSSSSNRSSSSSNSWQAQSISSHSEGTSSSSSSSSATTRSGSSAGSSSSGSSTGHHKCSCCALPVSDSELQAMCKEAHIRAKKEAPRLVREVTAAGWKVTPFLLSTTEKVGYVLL